MATMSTMQRFTHTLHNRDISLTAFLAHGKSWFCVKDVATCLGCTNTQQAMTKCDAFIEIYIELGTLHRT